MQYGGQVSPNMPDPTHVWRARAAALGIQVAGFTKQARLEDWGVTAAVVSEETVNGKTVARKAIFSRSYTMYRNPETPTHRSNQLRLDPVTERALEELTPANLPQWVYRARERMRYPSIWEAVQTHWFADEEGLSAPWHSPGELLRQHVEYVLRNRHRESVGLTTADDDVERELVSRSSIQPTMVWLDGELIHGWSIDTERAVVGVAVRLSGRRVLTAVVTRKYLRYAQPEFVSDAG